jgi:hypothetical protein
MGRAKGNAVAVTTVVNARFNTVLGGGRGRADIWDGVSAEQPGAAQQREELFERIRGGELGLGVVALHSLQRRKHTSPYIETLRTVLARAYIEGVLDDERDRRHLDWVLKSTGASSLWARRLGATGDALHVTSVDVDSHDRAISDGKEQPLLALCGTILGQSDLYVARGAWDSLAHMRCRQCAFIVEKSPSLVRHPELNETAARLLPPRAEGLPEITASATARFKEDLRTRKWNKVVPSTLALRRQAVNATYQASIEHTALALAANPEVWLPRLYGRYNAWDEAHWPLSDIRAARRLGADGWRELLEDAFSHRRLGNPHTTNRWLRNVVVRRLRPGRLERSRNARLYLFAHPEVGPEQE